MSAQANNNENRSTLSSLLSPAFFKALGDPNRLAILVRLSTCNKPCSVRRIAECCPVDLSVVSRHLSTMRAAGILESERQGKEVFYSVRAEWLTGHLRALAEALESGGCSEDCPCPFEGCTPQESRNLIKLAE